VPQILSRRQASVAECLKTRQQVKSKPNKAVARGNKPFGVFGPYASGIPLIQVLVPITEQSAVTLPSQVIPLCSFSALPHHDLGVDRSVQLSNHLACARQPEPCVTAP
jgi:hypothetical protein